MNKRIKKNVRAVINFSHVEYFNIISKENLFLAWEGFKRGKLNKKDVLDFSYAAEKNLLKLHLELLNKKYNHGIYETFVLHDPKPRLISKACVKDRIVHHAIVRILEPIYDKKFIYRSYSSRKNKGLHKAILELRKMVLSVTKNDNRSAYYLKCDIKKFFDSIDHNILINIIKKDIKNQEVLNLLLNVIKSFSSEPGKGLPLGNYTSQIFTNIYMHRLDEYIKRNLKIKYYIRYSDDFVLIHQSKDFLSKVLKDINCFLNSNLKLKLHENKIILNKVSKGIDFLGYVVFPNYVKLRTKTKKRILKKFHKKPSFKTLNSYIGITKHAYSNEVRRNLLKKYYYSKNIGELDGE